MIVFLLQAIKNDNRHRHAARPRIQRMTGKREFQPAVKEHRQHEARQGERARVRDPLLELRAALVGTYDKGAQKVWEHRVAHAQKKARHDAPGVVKGDVRPGLKDAVHRDAKLARGGDKEAYGDDLVDCQHDRREQMDALSKIEIALARH